MKNKLLLPIITSVAILFIANSCNKDVVGRTDDLPALAPAKNDLNAGTWKTILLSSPNDISLAAPVGTASPDYKIQINEIKSWQHTITEEEKALVAYWSAGAVLRWNEILRELVAQHNLPPYQNNDGTYPFPDANNPLAYPLFPFANPPYAARAYAYVSAAQYDALVSAYYYKTTYNRPAPYLVDASLNVLIPKSDIPSYPSEDAVVAGAASEMMKLLFPGDQDFIQKKLEEHKRARLISGANVRSDLEAGELLGRSVAQKFIARARGDRAGAAAGNFTIWAQLENDTKAKGEIPWNSLELPKRPPMLPLFGRVKAFLFDSATAVSLRPGPPPLTGSDQMKKELDEVYNYSVNRTREETRIVHFWGDGAGTYTPSGHWNTIAAEDFITKNFSEVRWARNLALLNMALMDAAIVCWDTKYYYFNPRPSQLNPKIKCATGLPNFPSYISGHSTFSASAAQVLGYILPERASAYEAMALEASSSRIYGAIHYRSDCAAGLEVGKKVGNFAVARGQADGAGN